MKKGVQTALIVVVLSAEILLTDANKQFNWLLVVDDTVAPAGTFLPQERSVNSNSISEPSAKEEI